MKAAPDHIPFGLRVGDARIVTAMEVPRGTACGCVCTVCGTPLQAHQGDILSWHFQHQADHTCSGSAETGLHLFAKQVIADKQAIYLPPLIAKVGSDETLVRRGRWVRLGNIRVENRLSFDTGEFLVPDVIAEMRTRQSDNTITRQDILIEVVVTHFSGDKKRRIIAEQKLPALEIHLARTLTYDKPGVYACTVDILRDAPRYWLWHEEQQNANARLDELLRQEEVQKAELNEWRRRFSWRNAEHKRFRAELEREAAAIRQYYERENVEGKFRREEVEQYRAVNATDVAAKRREKETWVANTADNLGKTLGSFAGAKLIAWSNDWKEHP
jgi:hypothetical protein